MEITDNSSASIDPYRGALRRELGIWDLALAQILIVIVPEFFGTAAKAGSAHGILWLVAIATFFVPQALVVSRLNRLMPLEGGLFEWVRHAFGNRAGFLVAWNIWLNTTIQVSQIALVTTTYLGYAFGERVAWMGTNPSALLTASVVLIAGMMVVARLGLSVGKWVSNAGSVFTVLILVVLAAIPLVHVGGAMPHAYRALPVVRPMMTLFLFSVFSKMTFGALTGFEMVAIFSGESRSPGRNLARSILLTAPLIAAMYILGTSSILAYVSPDAIAGPGSDPVVADELSEFVHAVFFDEHAPAAGGGMGRDAAGMVHGAHPKYKTPVNSILFVGMVALVASAVVLIGAGNQEAFVLLQIWSWTFYGLAYLAMFAIPLFAAKKVGAGVGLRVLAASGMAMTLMFVVLAVFPIVDVTSRFGYSMKVVLVIVAGNLAGWAVYGVGRKARG